MPSSKLSVQCICVPSCVYFNFPCLLFTCCCVTGTVISGYQVNSTYNLIGKGNPQWPQAFYPVENNVVIQKDDYLVTPGSPYKPFHFNVI